MTVRVPMRRWFAPVPMLAGVALIALTCSLGRWQLSRAHERIERQARIVALENAPAQRITAQPVTADSVMYRPVLLRGTFDVAHTVLLENRPHVTNDVSRPGFEVLIPLKLEGAGGRAVLVNRGWLPRDPADRTRIAPYTTPAGEVQVEGWRCHMPAGSSVWAVKTARMKLASDLGRISTSTLSRAKSACRSSRLWCSSNPTRRTACCAIGRAQTWAPTAITATHSSGSQWQRRYLG